MTRLSMLLFIFIGTTLAGSAMVAALASGYDTSTPILAAAAIGALLGIPVSVLIARALYTS